MSKFINFKSLASGTQLETPSGLGTFVSYKQGNFRNQDVLVEHLFGKLVWYKEDVLGKPNGTEATVVRLAQTPYSNSQFARL
ncbi:hypothetical protein ABID22_002198 [Pontibacter aydingkolensis]|uniref:Uncharacterized protein n=1 Tax=Pontibacter aydingkolensis TaxID=1911536 RepID=A0ABS7CVS5_9BACT|nr:hypothetical protein [Pontibacter aydingkolensis]MBW7467806.1 hypothetical protein [Pontibacter aydingkolensis]